MLEVLVKPLRLADAVLEGLFTGILYSTPGLTCVSITPSILRMAAHIRADVGLKTPDAIHAATALEMGCSLFITNDHAFRRVLALSVAVLSEVIVNP